MVMKKVTDKKNKEKRHRQTDRQIKRKKNIIDLMKRLRENKWRERLMEG